MGATSHQVTICPITSQFIVPEATPRPAMAPTAVIDVEAGTPKRFEISSARPTKKRTVTLAARVNSAWGRCRRPSSR